MAHNDNCAVKVLYRLFQNILCGHIEVVGRFVKNQQIHRLQKQTNHCQTCFFSTGKHFHLFVGGFTAKHESAEDVAYFGTYVAHGHTVDCVENRQRLVKELSLILCEIPDFDIMADFQAAVEGDFAHYTFYQRGFTFAVFPDKCHFLTTFDGECSAGKYGMGPVCFPHIVGDNRIISGSRSRWKPQVQPGRIHFIDLDTLYFCKLLHAALHLHGLCGLVAEPFDKSFRVGNLFLLVLISSHLLLYPLFAQLHEPGIIYCIIIDFAA